MFLFLVLVIWFFGEELAVDPLGGGGDEREFVPLDGGSLRWYYRVLRGVIVCCNFVTWNLVDDCSAAMAMRFWSLLCIHQLCDL